PYARGLGRHASGAVGRGAHFGDRELRDRGARAGPIGPAAREPCGRRALRGEGGWQESGQHHRSDRGALAGLTGAVRYRWDTPAPVYGSSGAIRLTLLVCAAVASGYLWRAAF